MIYADINNITVNKLELSATDQTVWDFQHIQMTAIVKDWQWDCLYLAASSTPKLLMMTTMTLLQHCYLRRALSYAVSSSLPALSGFCKFFQQEGGSTPPIIK